MPTTFHVTNFKNLTLNMLTGVSGTASPLTYINLYNGVQPSDPSVAPSGAAEFSSYSYAPNVNTKMSAAGGGITQLTVAAAPSTPAQASGMSGITFARIFNASGTALIDTPATTAGGGGGVIIDSTSCTAGVGNTVTAFSFKMPMSLNTVSLSASLANRLADLWGGGSSTIPNLGNVTGGSSSITIYSGSAPATADAPATGTALISYNMTSTNMWAAASGGASALNGAGPSGLATGSGTAGYFRLVKNNGAFVFTLQGTVGTSSADLLINTTSITSGVTTVQIVDATLTF